MGRQCRTVVVVLDQGSKGINQKQNADLCLPGDGRAV